jgi:hypothetical protein
MTEPKRWSSPGSEVDPVLRAVMRYGRELEPSAEQLNRLMQRSAASPPATAARRSRRALWSVVGIAAVFVTGGALAGYAVGARPAPTPRVDSTTPQASAPPSRRPARPAGAAQAAEGAAERPVAPAVRAGESATRRPLAPAPSGSVLDSARDAQLLQEARGVVTSNPTRALTLTRDHELHFPASALAEERHALRIEALARIGRLAEAEQALGVFNARFPRSIYTRRLQTLTSR